MQVMGALNASGFRDIGLVTEQGGPAVRRAGRLGRDAMRTGTKISAAGHGALIVLAVVRAALVRAARARGDPGDRGELRHRGRVRRRAVGGAGRSAARRPRRRPRRRRRGPSAAPEPEPAAEAEPEPAEPEAPEQAVAALEPPAAPSRSGSRPRIVTLDPPTAAVPPRAPAGAADRAEPDAAAARRRCGRPRSRCRRRRRARGRRSSAPEEPPAAPPEAAPETAAEAAPPAPLALETSGRPRPRRSAPRRAGARRPRRCWPRCRQRARRERAAATPATPPTPATEPTVTPPTEPTASAATSLPVGPPMTGVGEGRAEARGAALLERAGGPARRAGAEGDAGGRARARTAR